MDTVKRVKVSDAGNTTLDEKIEMALGMGGKLADLYGVSSETLEGVYSYAYDFYEKGRLDDAEMFFKFLCIYDFKNSDYLRGYASVCLLKKQFQRALDLYHVCFTLDPDNDYAVIFYMGLCLLGLKSPEKAKECFEMVMAHSHDEALKNKTAAYLELLSDLDNGVKQKDECD